MNYLTQRFFLKFLIIFSLLIISSQVEVYCKKNPNINKAKQLMVRKQYKEALDILLIELEKDINNEEVMSLIQKIETAKSKVTDDMLAGLQKIKSGDTVKAEEILSTLGAAGEFDKSIKEKMELFAQENQTLSKRNRFNALVDEAENAVLILKITDALSKYKEALDIFRINRSDDPVLNEIVRKFAQLESRIASFGLDAKWVVDKQNADFSSIVEDVKVLENKSALWKKHELDLLELFDLMDKVSLNTKKGLEYIALYSIMSKHIICIRAGINKIGREVFNNTIIVLERYFSNLKNRNRGEEYAIIKLIEYLYRAYEDGAYKTGEKSAGLLYSRLEELNFKEKQVSYSKLVYYDMIFPIFIAEIEQANVNRKYVEFQEYRVGLDLDKAFGILKDYDKFTAELFQFEQSAAKKAREFAGLQTDEIVKSAFARYRALNEGSRQIVNTFYKANEDYKDQRNKIEQLTLQAERQFREAVNQFNQRQFDISNETFNTANEVYIMLAKETKSTFIKTQMDRIIDYKQRIIDIKKENDIVLAGNLYDSARSYFYRENYEKSKEEIDKSGELYLKHGLISDSFTAFSERILTALRVKSGTDVKIDDPLYDMISELYKQAYMLFEEKDYQNALDLVSNILLEKPYNKNARVLETQILKMIDINSFNERFEVYFRDAKEKFDSGNFQGALTDFEQLTMFETRQAVINKYISDCKSKLRISRPDTKTINTGAAINLVATAERLFIQGKFQEAYTSIENALKIWEDVPKGSVLRTNIMIRLGTREVLLSSGNQVSFNAAQQAYAEGNYSEAIRLCRIILANQPDQNVQRLLNRAIQRQGQ